MKPGAGALRFGALCVIVWTSCSLSSRNGVVLLPVVTAMYADAVAPGAIQRVCAEDESDLPRYFSGRGLPYSAALVRTIDGRRCHIFYEPSVSGFRASPEDAAVSELVFGIDTAAFLSRREAVVGDGLDVMKQLLRSVERPLQVTLGLATEEDDVYRAALRYHFPDSKHRFAVQHHPVEDYNPWAQDYLKAGRVGAERKMLVTRQGFEGRRSMGAEIRPLLDAYAGPRYARSKLSWEGGDVQFAMHPREQGKMVMFYGTSAKRYWGDGLTREEFEYVMRVEFGADMAVYTGDLAPHVDYLMTLLPEARTALVSEPVCADRGLAKAALDVLQKRFGDGVPREIAELSGTMAVEWVEKAKQAHRGWRKRVDKEKAAKVEAYWAANCPGDERRCLQNGGLRKMVTEQPEVLRMWAEVAAEAQTESLLVMRLLDIVDAQLAACDGRYRQRLEQVIGMLGQMGFRVVRVPGIPGSTDPMSYWTGVSYVNAAVVDKTVFVPRLGLGAVEDGWIEGMRRAMPEGYAVVGVDARLLLLKNGGVHCVMAFGREGR